MAVGPTIEELLLGDDPQRWSALGFALEGDCCRLGSVRLRFREGAARGILGWTLRGVASTELDGLPTSRSEGPPPQSSLEASSPAHPNGVLGIDHVVAMSRRLDRSIAALERAGLPLRRVREQPTPAGAPRQAFFRLGREILEVIQVPEEVARRAGEPDEGARFWGLALRARDLERTAGLLGEHAGTVRPAVQEGRRITTLRRSAGLAVPLALISEPPRV